MRWLRVLVLLCSVFIVHCDGSDPGQQPDIADGGSDQPDGSLDTMDAGSAGAADASLAEDGSATDAAGAEAGAETDAGAAPPTPDAAAADPVVDEVEAAQRLRSNGDHSLGHDIAVLGDWIVASGPYSFLNDNIHAGVVFRGERAGPGQPWSWEGSLRPQGSHLGDQPQFGLDTALSRDWLVVGAPSADEGGVVYLYERQPDGSLLTKPQLMPPNASLPPGFGEAVAASLNRIAIGLPASGWATPGRVYIYETDGDDVGEPSILEGSSMTPGQSSDGFGMALDMEGERLVVGTDDEKAYVFERTDAGWVEVAVLRASVDTDRRFGWRVAISGDLVAVGAPTGGDVETTYLFARSSTGQWQELSRLEGPEVGGFAFDVAGPHVVTCHRDRRQCAYYRVQGDVVSRVRALRPNSLGRDFGRSVAVQHDDEGVDVFIGDPASPYRDETGSDPRDGALFVYRLQPDLVPAPGP